MGVLIELPEIPTGDSIGSKQLLFKSSYLISENTRKFIEDLVLDRFKGKINSYNALYNEFIKNMQNAHIEIDANNLIDDVTKRVYLTLIKNRTSDIIYGVK